MYKNFLVIFRAMYDDFVFKRFPLAKVIFLRAPMPKWLFMPTEHAETCYLRLTKHFLFQKCFCFKFCDGQIWYEYCFHISGSESLLHGFLHSLGRFRWTVTYSVIAIVITVSNSATIVIFVKRNFWSVFVSWFKAWPLWAHFWELNQFSIHPQEALLLLVFQCVDVFTGFVSIVTLASILLERMYVILWSLRHRTRRYVSTLAWLESRGYLVCWEFCIDFFFTSSLYPGWAS